MLSLLLTIVGVGIAFALVTSARKSLMAESESATCPRPHACQRKHR